jgi:hypothetical protein
MVSFVQLQDPQTSGICNSLLLSYSHLAVLFNRFQRSQGFPPGTRNWCLGRRYLCVFFLPFSVCVFVLTVGGTYLLQHLCTTLFA